tara:strand:+ start:326 stop:598 length:273 start_codon:yes stop_codon:yes gene_type:complete
MRLAPLGAPLGAGCLSNSSCGTEFFPECCQQLGFSYLTGLTITYTGVLDRLIALEVSERSERALMKTSILAMNRIPRNGYRHNGYHPLLN